MHDEIETFNKLRRKPISEVLNCWCDIYRKAITSDGILQYVEQEKYTLEEFLEAWFDSRVPTLNTRNKELWVKEYIKYHNERR